MLVVIYAENFDQNSKIAYGWFMRIGDMIVKAESMKFKHDLFL